MDRFDTLVLIGHTSHSGDLFLSMPVHHDAMLTFEQLKFLTNHLSFGV